MRKQLYSILAASMIFAGGCATPGKDSFDLARELERQNRLEDALPMYEDAFTKEGGNSEYRVALNSIRSRLAQQAMVSAREQLAITPQKYENLRTAQGFVDKALKIDSTNSEAAGMSESLKTQMGVMAKKAEDSYSAAQKAIEAKDWTLALNSLKDIRAYYPNYLDLGMKITATENNAVSYYLKEADRYRANDDVDSLITSLDAALGIQPANKQIAAVLNETKQKNTTAVNLEKAEKFATDAKWDRVQFYLKRAQKLGPNAGESDRIKKMYSDGGMKLLEQAGKDLQKKAIYSAYVDTMRAFEFTPAAFKTPEADELRNQIISQLLTKGEELDAAGYSGYALYLAECAYQLSGSQKEIYKTIQTLKDKVRQRVIKKIAIMDFNPPTNSLDAGRLVTDSLLSHMTKNASGDVKILARDVLGALIKEIELGQAGMYDIETAKKSGKLKGTDYFIFGSLLQYTVENNKEEGQKTVIAVVGKEKEPNPQYMAWLGANPKASEDERRNAPPAFIEKDKTETIRYKVATHRKTANVTISFRVVDVESGEVVITKTLKSKKEAVGNYSEGVDIAGIAYQRIELPPDSELLERAVDEAITDLGHHVLSRFQNLQESYLNAAETLKKKGETEPVAEKYMAAVVTEEVKNIKSPVTENARRELDRLLKQAENYSL
jgi:curli biogenesis system outer membrane secretion channel CsgG